MPKILFAFSLICSSLASGAEKTVRECAKELTRISFDLVESKANSYCKKYSQKTIDCAVNLKREKSMSHTLETALEDCDRKPEN